MLKNSDRRIVSINEAMANLVLAVRQQAIEDGRLADWEDYWLHSKEMRIIWQLALGSAAESASGSKDPLVMSQTPSRIYSSS